MARITYTHAHDHAVVAFTGELDWEAAEQLIDTIDTVVDEYFYTVVELVVSSPGGLTEALHYILKRLDGLEARQVLVRTRVLSSAGSAGAVLVSAGQERVAEPGSHLSYHLTQLRGQAEINAQATAAIHAALNEVDERMIGRLVDRALATSGAGGLAHQAERSDRGVLERLARSLLQGGRRKVPGKLGKLARAVGTAVDRAVRDADREALSRLYRHLFEIEATVSARLALTLRLIDRIGPVEATTTAPEGAEGLLVPEWSVLYPPVGSVPREALTRHALVLGETGSGKTSSCILPVVAAMARAPRERLGAALVIDPKRELGRVLVRVAPDRVHHVTADRAVLNIMSGPRWSLDEDLAHGRWLTAARRILCRVASFVPSSPARVLMEHKVGDSNSEFFDREGTALASTVLAFVLMLLDPATPDPERWLGHDVDAFVWVDDLLSRATDPEGAPNALALAAWVLEGPLMSCPSADNAVLVANPGDFEPVSGWLFARIALAARNALCQVPGEGRDLCERVLGYWSAMVLVDRQYAGVRAVASVVCSDFATPSIARTLYFGFEPGYVAANGTGNGLDFARLAGADGPGTLVLFQPARDGLDNLIAIALKALFFEAVLDDPDRAGGGADLPLVGYVADEFHRFVTSDPLHGEQSFLDTCRSFGAFCVLACQAVASIEHALAHGGGTADQNRSSVEIMWNNTASKLVFRSTDPGTAERVADLSPHRPGLAGVVRVRPVSTLSPGECYAVLADGRFERRQLERFRPEEPAGAGPKPVFLPDGLVQLEGRS